ncbi:cytochrome C [Sphingobacteriales bacterium TSM_CSM]|nr:cytochrome C [Sphingobacteriales bacterium TSM_CSM]
MRTPSEMEQFYLKLVQQLMVTSAILTLALLVIAIMLLYGLVPGSSKTPQPATQTPPVTAQIAELLPPPVPAKNWWTAPDTAYIPHNTQQGKLIAYGRQLIANTAAFLGPKGSVQHLSNGMNCQNCHLDAGTKVLGNNYSAVASTYPKFRERSGTIEDIPKRVNDCFERSLNGKPLPNNSKEMQAIIAYINWLGKEVPKGEKPEGSGIFAVPYLNRAASPDKGKEVYIQKCQSCHRPDGGGQLNPDGKTYLYPPLWGKNSYNTGAGLYRISRFAGYVKLNMPLGASHNFPQLTDEEAWDVAAFVNTQPRPSKDLSKDWPDIAAKPVDHPFGPYADGFSEAQHKYGPFQPIIDARKQLKSTQTAHK